MRPVSIRTNNPGAQWYGPLAQAYGATDKENLSDGNNAAVFPDPVSGAAAQFALLRKKYAGMPLSAAISKWSGGNSSPEYTKFLTDQTGLSPNTVLTPDLINGPQGLSLAKAQAHWEAGQPYPMSDADWQKAQTLAAGETPMSQAMKSGAQPMADQGALSPNAYLGPGALDAVSGGLQGLGAGLLSINNPAGGAAMMAAYQNAMKNNRPQLVDGGTDPLSGKKKWLLYDPQTQSFRPFGAGAGASSGGKGGAPSASAGDDLDTETFMANIGKVQNGQMSAEDFKKSMNPMLSDYAQALVNGTADPRMLGNRAGQLRPYAIMAAHVLDPNFNENQISARQAEAKNLATSNNPSTLGGAIASLGKVSLHGQELIDASEALSKLQAGGGTFRPLTTAENAYKKYASTDQDYKSKLNALKASVDLFAREADRLTSGGHPTLTGQEAIQGLFSPDASHEERLAAVRKVLGMSQDATNQLVFNNNNAFGRVGTPAEKKIEDFMSPATIKAWEKVQQSSTGAQPQTAAQGTPQQGPVPSKVINGKQYHLINGQWYME